MSGDAAVIRLYEIYVGTAEAVSERRGKTNNFFLAVNSTLITIDSLVLRVLEDALAALVVTAAGIILCFAWHRLIRSYRDLNRAKFSVICDLEKTLPAGVFTDEWRRLTDRTQFGDYVRLSRIEATVPWVFAGLYGAVLVLSLILALS